MNQHYRNFSFEYFLECQQRAGFQSIELWCGPPHVWLDARGHDDGAAIKRKVAERGLSVVSLTVPSFLWQYGYAAERGERAERSFAYFSKGIHLAAELGAGIVTVNSGWGKRDEAAGEAWKRSREMLSRLCDVAQCEGLVLALETLRSDESNLVNDLTSAKRMIGEVGHPALKAMVDTIAMGAAGEGLDEWFDAFGTELVHMHFLDGDPYVHNVWGDGSYPLEAMLQTLNERGYEGFLVQEVADERYFENPAAADQRNMGVLGGFVED